MKEIIKGYEYEAIKIFFKPEEYKEIEKHVKKTGFKKTQGSPAEVKVSDSPSLAVRKLTRLWFLQPLS